MNLTPTEHAKLLRELISHVRRGQSATGFRAKKELEYWRLLDSSYHPESVRQDIFWIKQADELIARARQAAEEIEAEQNLYLPSDRSRSGRVLARFGGGEAGSG